jgi:hypothetical protein
MPACIKKYEGKSKSKGAFQRKYIYFKYTETKLTSLFNVIPLDFNAPVPEFYSFFFQPEKSLLLFFTTPIPRANHHRR